MAEWLVTCKKRDLCEEPAAIRGTRARRFRYPGIGQCARGVSEFEQDVGAKHAESRVFRVTLREGSKIGEGFSVLHLLNQADCFIDDLPFLRRKILQRLREGFEI